MDFAQHTGQGYGAEWRGILFRETFKQLSDVITKTQKWFRRIFPAATYNKSDHTWTWPDGEELLLRYFRTPDDYWNYHGHAYPWIAWEELTSWLNLDCYDSMKTCCRSTLPNMPRKYRATANPWGRGHNAVKKRFIDCGPPGKIITNSAGQQRVRIHGQLSENKILIVNDPEYIKNLQAIKEPNKRKAWLKGSWDIIAGGAIDDVWDRSKHVLKPFVIPRTWLVNRCFDWGSSKPFAVGWWAISDGSTVKLADGTKRTFPSGTQFLICEWYGWNGEANEGLKMRNRDIAKGILKAEERIKRSTYGKNINEILAGPADASLFDEIDGGSMYDAYEAVGCTFIKSNKRPGSRIAGLEKLRSMLEAGLIDHMEDPGIFIFDICVDGFLRTVPVLQRDEKNPDDVDSATEDHAFDFTRYQIYRRTATITEVDTGV